MSYCHVLQHSLTGVPAVREACTDTIQLALNFLVLHLLEEGGVATDQHKEQNLELYKSRTLLVAELCMVSDFAVSSI